MSNPMIYFQYTEHSLYNKSYFIWCGEYISSIVLYVFNDTMDRAALELDRSTRMIYIINFDSLAKNKYVRHDIHSCVYRLFSVMQITLKGISQNMSYVGEKKDHI